MSPEQAVGRPLTPATDIFSAGLILYELICSLRPFDADSETETLRLVRACDVKAPRTYIQELPEAVDALVMKALSADPSERFESAGAMARAIQHFLVLDDSQAGPGALSDFLRDVFPDGVVPTEAPQPRSLDDALLNQLDAFTPSFAKVEHTQTQTKTSGIERISVVDAMMSDTGSSQPSAMANSTHEAGPNSNISVIQGPPTGRKRMLAFGLFLGILGTIAVLLTTRPPQTFPMQVTIQPDSARQADITVDGAPFARNDNFPVGRTYTVCAQATYFETNCRRHTHSTDASEVSLRLAPYPRLEPQVTPKNAPHRILVDRVLTSKWPLRLEPGKEYVVCVESQAYSAEPPCQRVRSNQPILRPAFKLTKRTREGELEPPNRKPVPAQRPASKKSAKPEHVSEKPIKRSNQSSAKKVGSKFITLRSIPRATVFRLGKEIGVTPFKFRLDKKRHTMTLKAKGYADTNVMVDSNTPAGIKTVILKRPGYLTVRVKPSASTIFIDGKKVGRGVLVKHPVTPGQHTLRVVYAGGANQTGSSQSMAFSVDSGQHLRHPPVEIRLSE